MNRPEGIDGLQFHDQTSSDQKIKPTLSYRDFLIRNLDDLLSPVGNPPKPKLHRQGILIHSLQETRPETAMHLDRRPDHPMNQLIDLNPRLSPL
jgi:hypothetical protein